jgi:hypothetical protein
VKNLLTRIGGIGDIINNENVLTTLNALPSSFESFVQGITSHDDYRPLRNFLKNYYKKITKGHFEEDEIMMLKFQQLQ